MTKIRQLEDVELYAWVGDDELGDGGIGLKQGFTRCGLIPLVAVRKDRMDSADLVEQLREGAKQYKTPKYLCRFTFDRVEMAVGEEV